ncbi:MAG: cupin domain-containing protein [Mesorhizobium sp.]|nr:MAG: cupin domain-containing protein [Mesorhizobium sp.]
MEKTFAVIRRKDAKLAFEEGASIGSSLDRVIDETRSDEMGAGYFAFNGTQTAVKMQYDEIALCLEGILKFTVNGQVHKLAPGDFAWIPKGTEVTFSGEQAVAFYAAHPVDWRKRNSAAT